MAKLLIVASIIWPLLLASGWWARSRDEAPWLTATVYVAAGRVCHQRPDRSFFTGGAPWPVCGRCAGLYLAAPLGALAALASPRRGRRSLALWLGIAAVPTALTLVAEVAGLAHVASITRAVAAVPLGAAAAFAVVTMAGSARAAAASGHQVH
jgi:uncharacterized membrane protein